MPLDIALHTAGITLPGTSLERRRFDYFRQRTASALAGHFDSEFWYQLVLQVSQAEPAVRHAVVALGSLHETLDKGAQEFGNRSQSLVGREFSLQQYDKSVTSLRSRLVSGDGNSVLEVALICCVLFNSFETLHGNHDQALLHLQNGLKIMQEWTAQRRRTSFLPEPTSTQYELSQVFSRLNVQARSLLDPELPPFHNLSEIICFTVPETFKDLTQARDFLYALYNDGFAFYQKMTEQIRSGASTPSMASGPEPFNPLVEFGRLDSYLIQWLRAFDKFLEQNTASMGSKELRGATLLRIHYLCAFIVLHKSIRPEQCAFDTYNSHFDQMVSLSSAFVHSTEGPDPTSATPAFSIDLGIIAPLYYTAVSCRDPTIRRRAVSALSSPRHEGAWSAVDAARVGFLAIQIEEDGLGEVRSSSDVPESSRLSEIHTAGPNTAVSKRDQIRLRCAFSGRTSPEETMVKEFWLDSCV